MHKIIACLSPVCLLAAVPAAAQEIPVQPVAAPAPAATPAPVEDAAPRVPEGFAATFAAPPREADGSYRTPNRDLSPAEVTWHLRAALNVAALGCRDQAPAYNAMLTTEKEPLAAADAAAQAGERARYAAGWQAHHDDAMTRLYNYFAQPPAQAGFCAAAADVLREAATVEPANFAAFAGEALPRLEAPFLAAFARFDGYRITLAEWKARHAPAVEMAAVVPAPAVEPAAATVPAPAPEPVTAKPPVLLASVTTPAITPDKP